MDDALYSPAQGELERGPKAGQGQSAAQQDGRFLTCTRVQGTAWTAWSRNDTAVREPPKEHVRVISEMLRRALSDEPVAVQLFDPMNHQTQAEQWGFDW